MFIRHAAHMVLAGLAVAFALSTPRSVSAHSTMIINDPVSPGVLGDDRLSLHEALWLANGTLQIFQVSPAEAAQVVLDPGRFQIDTLVFDETVFPGTIVLEAPLPVLDDPIGDYVDGTNFNIFPIGSMVLDGSHLPAGTPAFDVRAGNTGLYGWRLRNFPGHAIHIRPNPTFDIMRGLLIQRNIVEDCAGVGIFVESEARDRIDWAFLLLENWLTRCQQGGIVIDGGSGTSVQMSFTLEANLIVGSGVRGGTIDGIAIRGGAGGTVNIDGRVVKNELIGNAGSGLLLDGGSTGTVLGVVASANETTANGIGITILGATGAGAQPNDVSLSVRGHVSIEDELAAIVATAGADPLATNAFCSVSLNDLVSQGGAVFGGILGSSGDGQGNQLSLSIVECEVLRPAGHGLELAASRSSLDGQRVDLRCVSLHVIDPGGDGFVFESGGGRPSALRGTLDAAFVRGGDFGLRVDALGGTAPSDRVDLTVTGSRFSSARSAAVTCRAHLGMNTIARFSTCCFDGSSGDDVVVDDPLGVGGVQLELGSASRSGANAFVGHNGCALVVPPGTAPVSCVGNWFGASSGPSPGGGGKCVLGNVVTTPFLTWDPTLRLDLDRRITPVGGTVNATLEGTAGTPSALFVGTRVLDLTAFGQPLILDPTSGPVVLLGLVTLPGSLALPIPNDPALVDARVLLQAFGAQPGDGRLSRVHALSLRS